MTHRWRLESRRKKRRFSWPIGVVWTWRAGNILTTYIQPPCDLNVYCMYGVQWHLTWTPSGPWSNIKQCEHKVQTQWTKHGVKKHVCSSQGLNCSAVTVGPFWSSLLLYLIQDKEPTCPDHRKRCYDQGAPSALQEGAHQVGCTICHEAL